MLGTRPRWVSLALGLGIAAALGAWLDLRYRLGHAGFRRDRPSVLRGPAPGPHPPAVAAHPGPLASGDRIGLACSGRSRLGLAQPAGRRWLAIFAVGYAIRAVIWICGGNLPLVPGDSCHYLEVATSVLRGEGPVKHYVDSFFRDYSHILEGRGVLDDWDTPLDAYVRALAFRLAGLSPESPIEARITAAKACSFIINLLCLPALYVFARRRYDGRVALGRWLSWRCCRCTRFMRGSCFARAWWH